MSIDFLGAETRVDLFVHQIFIEGSVAQAALEVGAKRGRNVPGRDIAVITSSAV